MKIKNEFLYIRFLRFGKYSTISVRVPDCEIVHFNGDAIHAALDERDRLCRKKGIDPYNFKKGRNVTKNPIDKSNQNLPVGISEFHDRRLEITFRGYQVSYSENKKNKTKRFLFCRYETKEKALKSAIKFRLEKKSITDKEIKKNKQLIIERGFD